MSDYDFILDTTQAAGELLLQKRDEGFETTIKHGDPQDIVTSVDRAVNTFIVDKIRAAFPDDSIYSEEGEGIERRNTREWTIDPIDGSANFSRNVPHFAVCLGLLEDSVPVAGAIYNPVTRELFSFKKGMGAFFNGKPVHVSERTELKDAMIFLRAGRGAENVDWGGESYRRLLLTANKTSGFGSSALDVCFVAAGRIEACVYGTLNTLDIAAAFGLLKEAGGVLSTRTGEEPALTPDKQRLYIANNQQMLEHVRSLLEAH